MLEQTLEFKSYDLEANGFVRISAIMRRLQQIATDDLRAFGITYRDMREKNMAFVLSRMAILFERPIVDQIPLTIKTAANPTHGATFPRSFAICDEHGLCMRATSLWALLDFEKRSLLRPAALGVEIPAYEDVSFGLTCERLTLPDNQEPALSEKRRVYPSMLDQNNHLNNCNYADLATDLLPFGGVVREIQIAFQHEACCGETLLLTGYGKDRRWLVNGAFGDRDQSCFLCQIKLF